MKSSKSKVETVLVKSNRTLSFHTVHIYPVTYCCLLYVIDRCCNSGCNPPHRSAQNAKDLATLGITSERQLMGVFRNALKNGSTVSTRTNNYGVSVTRSIAVGDQGAVNVSFFYAGGNMSATPSVTTLIPKIYK